jgi:hypothetical protein
LAKIKNVTYDCGGAVVKEGDPRRLSFLCLHCGRPFAVLTKDGLLVTSRHGGGKDKNLIPTKALKVLMRQVEQSAQDEP